MARSGIRFRWARGWSRGCCESEHSQRTVPRHGHQRRCVDGNVNRRSRFFEQKACVEQQIMRTGWNLCQGIWCLHLLAGPRTASACCSGRAGTFGGDQPGFVARPLEARRFIARGNWHASIYGCAVTGARTRGDVGGCLVTRGARKWRLEGVKRGEIGRRNVGIRVLGMKRRPCLCARGG